MALKLLQGPNQLLVLSYACKPSKNDQLVHEIFCKNMYKFTQVTLKIRSMSLKSEI